MGSEVKEDNQNEFKFPECWENDVRMGALFAPFRSKNLNPNDWSSKMKFWTSLIDDWCKHQKCPVISITNLKKEFSRKGVEPACLDEVVNNLHSTGMTVLKEDFVKDEDGWKVWVIKKLLTQPLKWSFQTIRNALGGKADNKDVEYVLLSIIKYLGNNFLKKIPPELRGKLVTTEEIMKFWDVKDSECLLLVLLSLKKQGSVAITDENNCTLVKLPEKNGKPVEIKETDLGICNLEKQQKALELNIERLEKEKLAALDETKKHLAANMKSMAKMSLRKKKEIENRLEKRTTILENIQALLNRIDEVKMDGDVIDCYRTGMAALKTAFNETGLNEVNVATTMDELEEVLRLGTDVSESLSKPLDVSADRSLEDELNELLLEELPSVPAGDIPVPKVQKEKKKKQVDESLKSQMEALTI